MTTLQRTSNFASSYTLTCKTSTGALVTPSAIPTASMFTDAARTAGVVVLTVTATAQPQVFTVTLPATATGARFLRHLSPTPAGQQIDADDDVLFSAVVGAVSTGIVSLADTKAYLDITTTKFDAELLRLISQATGVVQQLAGPTLIRQPFTERVTALGGQALLQHYPVVSVVTITAVVSGASGLSAVAPTAGGY